MAPETLRSDAAICFCDRMVLICPGSCVQDGSTIDRHEHKQEQML